MRNETELLARLFLVPISNCFAKINSFIKWASGDFFQGKGGGQLWDNGKEKYIALAFLTHFIVPI